MLCVCVRLLAVATRRPARLTGEAAVGLGSSELPGVLEERRARAHRFAGQRREAGAHSEK